MFPLRYNNPRKPPMVWNWWNEEPVSIVVVLVLTYSVKNSNRFTVVQDLKIQGVLAEFHSLQSLAKPRSFHFKQIFIKFASF
jgi:hypothetical protein